jgi:hypothetical protein
MKERCATTKTAPKSGCQSGGWKKRVSARVKRHWPSRRPSNAPQAELEVFARPLRWEVIIEAAPHASSNAFAGEWHKLACSRTTNRACKDLGPVTLKERISTVLLRCKRFCLRSHRLRRRARFSWRKKGGQPTWRGLYNPSSEKRQPRALGPPVAPLFRLAAGPTFEVRDTPVATFRG